MKDIKNFINEGGRSGRHVYFSDMVDDLEVWWEDNCTEDCYNSHSEYIKAMKALAKKQDYSIVDDAIEYLDDKLRWPEWCTETWEKDIIKTLVKWAEDAIK